MHVLFRTIGQQMGLERVRGILDESIDDFLNAAIIETATNIVKSNVQTIYRDKVAIENNDISPINGVYTLYSEKIENASDYFTEGSDEDGSEEPVIISPGFADIMYFIGVSVKYIDDKRWRNCRIIEPTKLEQSFDDYLNRASARYPIVHFSYLDTLGNSNSIIEIYHGKSVVDSIKIKYLRMPVTVKLDTSVENKSVDCDMPEHLHKEIVELAVQKFFNSVGSTTHNVRQ